MTEFNSIPTYKVKSDGSVDLGGHVIPVPATISAPAAAQLRLLAGRPEPPKTPLWTRRDDIDVVMLGLNERARTRYAVDVDKTEIAGVACHLVRPSGQSSSRRALLNLHAGGFVAGSESLVEAIPIAALTNTPVIAIDYRLAPEFPYPAAVDDALAVYRQVLTGHAPHEVAIFGTSAGGFLTGQVIARLLHHGLPVPACAGMFSAGGDLRDLGDTPAIFTMGGFTGDPVYPPGHAHSDISQYLAGADPGDPLVSPARGELAGFPPTLLLSGTRDALLSPTALMHRALRRAGVEAELYVYEAMAHGFWYALDLPETAEALNVMAGFFTKHLGAS